MLTEKQVQSLVAERKIITANMRWQQSPSRGSSYTVEVGVLSTESNAYLRLVGTIGRRNRSFVLLYENQPIRKYTAHARHHNPDCNWIRGPHKHSWDELHDDGVAYVPGDIQAGDPNNELLGFLRECNIEMRGTYQPIMSL